MKYLHHACFPNNRLSKILFLLVCALCPQVYCQSLDTFNPNANSTIYAIALQLDGKVLVGGDFTTLGGQARDYLGRVHPDGSLDLSFDPGANGRVQCITVQRDGKILVSGMFSNLAGVAISYLGRLRSDGSIDPGFSFNGNGLINSIALQSDGKILIAGEFAVVNGSARRYIARLNSNGTLDDAFDPDANNWINTLAVQKDGKIIVGGIFTQLGGQTKNRIARLEVNGSLDPNFTASAASGSVSCLAIQPDGKIIVGGSFSSLGGLSSLNGICRLDASGVAESGFTPRPTGAVHSISLQTDGRMLLGGEFSVLNGYSRIGIGRVNTSGGLDTNFFPAGVNGNVIYGLVLQPDGKILVGGNFTLIGGQARNCIARLNNSSALQHLTFNGTNINWSRTGTGAEIVQAEFQSSTNGIDWVDVGVGEYTSNAWTLTGLNLPVDINIRARGLISGGYRNNSGGQLETIIGPPVIITPPISRTNNSGTIATFSVLSRGTESFGYQWRRTG